MLERCDVGTSKVGVWSKGKRMPGAPASKGLKDLNARRRIRVNTETELRLAPIQDLLPLPDVSHEAIEGVVLGLALSPCLLDGRRICENPNTRKLISPLLIHKTPRAHILYRFEKRDGEMYLHSVLAELPEKRIGTQ